MNIRVLQIDPHKVRLLAVNAHYMRHETFKRLVDNVEGDAALTSVPFAWRLHDDATQQPILDEAGEPIWECLSGNHRVRAAVAANVPSIHLMVTDDYLTPDHRRAIQISHNALVGEDDPATLRTVYSAIVEPSYKLYSGLDDKQLGLLEKVQVGTLAEANLVFQPVTMLFLPDEIDQLNKTWDEAKRAARKMVWLNPMRAYDEVMDALETAQTAYTIKNTATALLLVLEVFSRHMDDLNEGWFDGEERRPDALNAPIAGLFNTHQVPADTGALVMRAINKRMSAGGYEHRWQVLEAWARADLGPTEQKGAEHATAKKRRA